VARFAGRPMSCGSRSDVPGWPPCAPVRPRRGSLSHCRRLSHDCMLAEATFQSINGPVAAGRQRASGLRFADPRTHQLLQALILFRPRLPLRRSPPPSCHAIRPRPRTNLPRRHHLSTPPPAPARLPAQKLPLSRHRLRPPRRPVFHLITASCARHQPPHSLASVPLQTRSSARSTRSTPNSQNRSTTPNSQHKNLTHSHQEL
jgi:hypothetical protein